MRGTYPTKDRHRSRIPAKIYCPKSLSCRSSGGSPRHPVSSRQRVARSRKFFCSFPWSPPCAGPGSRSSACGLGGRLGRGVVLCPERSHLCKTVTEKVNCACVEGLLTGAVMLTAFCCFRFLPGKGEGKVLLPHRCSSVSDTFLAEKLEDKPNTP